MEVEWSMTLNFLNPVNTWMACQSVRAVESKEQQWPWNESALRNDRCLLLTHYQLLESSVSMMSQSMGEATMILMNINAKATDIDDCWQRGCRSCTSREHIDTD